MLHRCERKILLGGRLLELPNRVTRSQAVHAMMDLTSERIEAQEGGVEFVAEPPKLSRLKCAGHHYKGNISSNALQTE